MTAGSAGQPVWIRGVGAGIKGFLRQVESCQRKPFPGLTYSSIPCRFINIHQRTKTFWCLRPADRSYQFINIHQRTKTIVNTDTQSPSISLSISIREPKQSRCVCPYARSISLSISIREPKPQDIVVPAVLAALFLLNYISRRSLVSRKCSSFICSPHSSFIWVYCFSVISIARTEPAGGR